MKKDRKWFLSIMFGVLVVACTVDAYDTTSTKKKKEDVNKPLSETWHTYPENFHCLNVVYYVPADMDTLSLWHKRLSGLTLNTQKFFEQNMQRNRFDKTFGLVVNDSNTNYISIDYIKSKRTADKMQITDAEEMAAEVMEYFKANPDRKRSNHFLVYMPEYTGAFFNTVFLNPSNNEVPDHAMAFCGCDTEKFDPKFLTSARGSKAYLGKLGQSMLELSRAFFQTDNNGPLLNSRFSLSGSVKSGAGLQQNYLKYAGDNESLMLTETDALWLNQIQVFNEVGSHEYKPLEKVTIEAVKFSWEEKQWENLHVTDRDSLLVECFISTTQDLAGVVMYIDPWGTAVDADHINSNMRNDGDGMAICIESLIEEEDNKIYGLKFRVKWSDMNTKNIGYVTTDASLQPDPVYPTNPTRICKAEIRFRFIGVGGMAYPHPSVSIKGDWNTSYRIPFYIRQYQSSGGVGSTIWNVPDLLERYPDYIQFN